ncbi:MAG: hypothetical protein AB7J63_00875 [Vicinamibacterales bacterium]
MTTFVVLAMALGGLAFAQAPAPGSASEFYLQYRKVFDGAKKVEELLPYMSAATRKQVESTPPSERSDMFEMLKMMGAITELKIAKEARSANGATLTVEALDPDKAKITGTIDIVKEGTAWKLGKESWKSQ